MALCCQIVCGGEPTKAFGGDSTALQRVDGPVVVLESVHQLQDGTDTADGGVDGGAEDDEEEDVEDAEDGQTIVIRTLRT